MRRRAQRLMGGGRIVHFDRFTEDDGAVLVDHPSDSGAPWVFRAPGTNDPRATVVNAGGVQQATGNQTGHMTLLSRLRRKNCRVEADLKLIDATANSQIAALILRSPINNIGGGPRLFYEFRVQQAATPAANLAANGVTTIASVAQTLTLNQVYRMAFEVRGSVLIGSLDGTIVLKTSSALVGKGASVGLRLSQATNNPPSHRLDNWIVTR